MFVNTIALTASTVPVKSATIFQSSTAELTRALVIGLKSGRNVVEISGISSSVDPESPRISGVSGDVRVLDVVCRRKPNSLFKTRREENSPEIRELVSKGVALEAERQVLRQEAALLDDSAGLVTKPQAAANGQNSGNAIVPDQVLDFLEKFVQRKMAVNRALQSLDERIGDLEDKLSTLRNAHKGTATAVITTTIIATSDCKASLNLTYLVSGVTWRPFYDLHATTVEGQPSEDVSMRYCASISQSTGEGWNDLTLTLSTASSQALQQLSVPSLNPLKLTAVSAIHDSDDTPFGPRVRGRGKPPTPQPFSAYPPIPPPSYQGRAGLFGTSPFAAAPHTAVFGAAASQRETVSSSSGERRAPRSPSRSPQAEEHTDHAEALPLRSSPTRSSLSVAYRVEGAVSLPSDGEEHKLTVALLNFKAVLKYVCVPRQSPTVYIVSKVKNTSDLVFPDVLAGTVNVFMNDGFVTKTSIGLIPADEQFDCVFGVDPNLKVLYQQSEKIQYEPRRSFAEPQKTTTRTTLTTVKNQHKFNIAQLVIRDAIPLGSETDKIAVVLRKPPGLAEAKEGQEVIVQVDADGNESEKAEANVRWSEVVDGQGGEKDGLFEWVCTIPAGKKITLESQWDVKSPGEIRWKEQATQQ
ncbi:hypothetical protein BD414DRAFT_432034 [Trametes punicea]|nr:hypothetical protein BD414DRAFT_432034 [Trametes punicea]